MEQSDEPNYSAPVARQPNVCPSDQEIRNLETKANSITLGQREKQFLYDELRRARQCSKGQGNYSGADWEQSRAAQAAQSNNSGREASRIRAEGVHSAADPIEGDRIANRRAQEAAAERVAEEVRKARVQRPPDITISHCNAFGCWANGGYYSKAGNGYFSGPTGFCRAEGNVLKCQ